jgi:hypothetical protein
LEQLTVLFDGQPVGHLVVAFRDQRRIRGQFVAGPGFDRCRGLFEKAARWCESFLRAESEGDVYHPRSELYFAAIEVLSRRVALPEVDQAVEEFGVYPSGTVDVFLHPHAATVDAAAEM